MTEVDISTAIGYLVELGDSVEDARTKVLRLTEDRHGDLASFPVELSTMTQIIDGLPVPRSEMPDEQYATGDILVDLKRLYARQKLFTELYDLLEALRAEISCHGEEVQDRIKLLNRMLAERLCAV